MAPRPRDPNPSGLGRAIINKKVKDAKKMRESRHYSVDTDSASRMKSVTQERDLDEFLNTAQLAGTTFTAERRNVKIIQQSSGNSPNPYLLSPQEEENVLKRQSDNKERLRVPRRPPWTRTMTTEEVDKHEKQAFLDWRRGLAELQEQDKFLLTPFERNIEVWRQLWRVLERSHLVVQIVDARNPLRFRCEDLEDYVRDIKGSEGEAGTGRGARRSMLLINKADLLTAKQRRLWAEYFEEHGILYAFYSAANAAALQQARRDALPGVEEEGDENEERKLDSTHEEQVAGDDDDEVQAEDQSEADTTTDDGSSSDDSYFSAQEDTADGQDPRVKILSVVELEELLLKMAPDLSKFIDALGQPPSRLVVGLVGYPNVGKSSTINSLLGEKKVSVSSTPGKTKHFQTIHLSDSILLCDCPGLVFPQFATTKAELICDGVLPIDQMREYTGPIALLVRRIPKEILEAIYGLSIRVKDPEEGGDGLITAEDLLMTHAIARGFMRSGQGNPDEARSARYILKDYVNGKLLFCHAPPNVSESEFNQETRENALVRAVGKKRAPTTRVGKRSDTFVQQAIPMSPVGGSNLPVKSQGFRSRVVDTDFFEDSSLSYRPIVNGKEFTRLQIYPHQRTVADDGTPSTPQPAGAMTMVAKPGKKHKKMKRVKQRSGKGYD